jgi:hypothetical protein
MSLVRTNAPDIEAIALRAAARRSGAVTIVDVSEPTPDLDAAEESANALLRSHELGYGPPPRWRDVNEEDALRILADNLCSEPAYDTADSLPRHEADAIASAFLGAFPPPRRILTNATFDVHRGLLRATAFTGTVTRATFEAGIVVVTANRAGLFYIMDED